MRGAVAGLCMGSLLSGLWLRAAEAELTAVPLKLQSDQGQYRYQRQPGPGNPPGDPIPSPGAG